ncbi:acetolactate synthase small subunit [Solitalea sp. MAHUQ-68]|uniref:Acetolactate synthase small subunit n=1 Tax=Solitalea agri TaxID=2953739 RepID=A0A9X2F8J3_9SPHI|nr:acetolactate synthase small subunit [Solitalea agri]MCO4293718.1 acetolactate synthase small subunit [Solitalea agri]
MEKLYTISVFTENNIGLLNRLTIIFTRRRINIESLTVSETEKKGISRFTVVVKCTEDMSRKLVQQINKVIEVLIAYAYDADNMIFSEVAIYKVNIEDSTKLTPIVNLANEHGARVMYMEPGFAALEKTGTIEDLMLFYDLLKPFGLLEFVHSGRIAIHKQRNQAHELYHAEELAEYEQVLN